MDIHCGGTDSQKQEKGVSNPRLTEFLCFILKSKEVYVFVIVYCQMYLSQPGV